MKLKQIESIIHKSFLHGNYMELNRTRFMNPVQNFLPDQEVSRCSQSIWTLQSKGNALLKTGGFTFLKTGRWPYKRRCRVKNIKIINTHHLSFYKQFQSWIKMQTQKKHSNTDKRYIKMLAYRLEEFIIVAILCSK